MWREVDEIERMERKREALEAERESARVALEKIESVGRTTDSVSRAFAAFGIFPKNAVSERAFGLFFDCDKHISRLDSLSAEARADGMQKYVRTCATPECGCNVRDEYFGLEKALRAVMDGWNGDRYIEVWNKKDCQYFDEGGALRPIPDILDIITASAEVSEFDEKDGTPIPMRAKRLVSRLDELDAEIATLETPPQKKRRIA